jgi:hypothetical protein
MNGLQSSRCCAVADSKGLPVPLALSPGGAHDVPLASIRLWLRLKEFAS